MNKGFSLVETLIVLSILAIIGTVSFATYNGSRQAGAARKAATTYADALKEASFRAKSMEFDTAWGVRIITGDIVIFSGNTYATRTTSRDRAYDIDGALTTSGPAEIVFSKFAAVPSTTGTTTFSNSFASSSVYVLSSGVIGE